jgi:uncharacterized membrane protein YhaH (DUF805 family)
MSLALQQAADRWPARAIHDTVAAIVREGGYGRTLTQSLLGRLFQFIVDRVSELLAFLRGTPNLRFITIAATAILVIAIVARLMTVRRLRDDARRAARVARVRGQARDDPWALAQSLAATGNYSDAVHALYAAVIEELAAARSIRLHPSKTSGDYAHELRLAGSPIAPQFRAFSRRLDRAIYGVREWTADDFDALVREARPLIGVREAA